MSMPDLSYAFKYPGRIARAITRDPADLWDTFRDRVAQRRENRRPPFVAGADKDWEAKLCVFAGADSFSGAIAEFDALWPEVLAMAEACGLKVGPESFAGFNDGDRGLARALYCLVRCGRMEKIVETGVAHGFTTRFILEAITRNGRGHLWSIDRPPLDPAMRERVGVVARPCAGEDWTLIRNSSRRALPGLLRNIGPIDLFVHDSLHTERNVLFELGQAWPALRPGGFVVIDDIDSNWGFEAFTKTRKDFRVLVCEAEPVRPDERRFNKKGLFAILTKDGAA
ncbi:MAG: class I SAM-dependent methyltransferase [Alphaproteobacteria bacterium]